jgi:Fe2+ or Zn2+ uptake regulation protein
MVPHAILRVLTSAGEPLSVAAIHEAVEEALGHAVSRSTVKNFLAKRVQAGDSRLVRLDMADIACSTTRDVSTWGNYRP